MINIMISKKYLDILYEKKRSLLSLISDIQSNGFDSSDPGSEYIYILRIGILQDWENSIDEIIQSYLDL